jgi:hypothetical protein
MKFAEMGSTYCRNKILSHGFLISQKASYCEKSMRNFLAMATLFVFLNSVTAIEAGETNSPAADYLSFEQKVRIAQIVTSRTPRGWHWRCGPASSCFEILQRRRLPGKRG